MNISNSLDQMARLRASRIHRSAANNMLLRSLAILATAALVVAMFVTAGAWSNAAALERVARNASELHIANATAGSAGIARAAISQAIVFEADRQLGITSAEDATAALDEARLALASFTDVSQNADTEAAYAAAAREVLQSLERGSVATADRIRRDSLEPTYRTLANDLAERQRIAEDGILEIQTTAGRTAGITRILTTLAIPAVAMLVYWAWARRRIRDEQQEMRAWVEAERAVGRAKDELIAGISHELRTPLTSIHGFAEILLEDGFEDTATVRDLVSIIHTESNELSRMIDDLLTAARIDAGQLSVANERTRLLDCVYNVVEPFTRRGIEVATSCPDVNVVADPLRLRQVIRNLVSNAARHGGDNIAVMVETTSTRALITVADDGPGVPEEIIHRLFDRFVNGGKGALLAGSVGLGLSVARELMERMDGTIEYTRMGDITMFELTVPLAVARERPLVAAS